MQTLSCLRAIAHAGLLAVAFACPSARAAVAAETTLARVTILYDAFGKDPGLVKDWGYSALVEVRGKRILFDTGNNAEVFLANAKAKGIDFSTLDFVVESHRHADHLAGLAEVLKANPKVKIYAPKETFSVYGSSLPSSFYRKKEQLPPEQRYWDGKPAEVLKFGTVWEGANIEWINETTEVAPGIWLIALVSDATGTKELKELSLAVTTPEGLVLVVGCSHPGIDKIVEAAAAINPKIHYVLGGFHLVTAPDETIAAIVASLHDKWNIENIAPGHCTGEPTFAALIEAFGARYVYAGVGTAINVGSRRAESRSLVQKASFSPAEPLELRGQAARLTGAELAEYLARAQRSPDALEPKMMKWLRASFRRPEPEARP
jgi:7,8-dihydropterin-6-yl-methyl-4-(beta-D-ribofuranosyl)aminobenzene 5'-phosphate synthase